MPINRPLLWSKPAWTGLVPLQRQESATAVGTVAKFWEGVESGGKGCKWTCWDMGNRRWHFFGRCAELAVKIHFGWRLTSQEVGKKSWFLLVWSKLRVASLGEETQKNKQTTTTVSALLCVADAGQSKCRVERNQALEQARRPQESMFIPECNEDGTFAQVQKLFPCHVFYFDFLASCQNRPTLLLWKHFAFYFCRSSATR